MRPSSWTVRSSLHSRHAWRMWKDSSRVSYVAPKGASEGSVIEGIELPATNSSNLPGFNASQTQPTEAPAAPATETPEN